MPRKVLPNLLTIKCARRIYLTMASYYCFKTPPPVLLGMYILTFPSRIRNRAVYYSTPQCKTVTSLGSFAVSSLRNW